MNKPTLLAQLAFAGIAAGMLSVSNVSGNEAKAAVSTAAGSEHAGPGKAAGDADTAKTVKAHKKAHKKAVTDSSATATTAPTGSAVAPVAPAATHAAAAPDKHSCKGQNSCKGQGGCAMSDKDIEAAAKKASMAMDMAGKAHSCKGKNECKGLGGCKMM